MAASRSLENIMFLPSQSATLYSPLQNQGLSLKGRWTTQVLQRQDLAVYLQVPTDCDSAPLAGATADCTVPDTAAIQFSFQSLGLATTFQCKTKAFFYVTAFVWKQKKCKRALDLQLNYCSICSLAWKEFSFWSLRKKN